MPEALKVGLSVLSLPSTAVSLLCPPPPLIADFGFSVCFAADRTVAAARGELDLLGALARGRFVETGAECRECPVVIDDQDQSSRPGTPWRQYQGSIVWA